MMKKWTLCFGAVCVSVIVCLYLLSNNVHHLDIGGLGTKKTLIASVESGGAQKRKAPVPITVKGQLHPATEKHATSVPARPDQKNLTPGKAAPTAKPITKKPEPRENKTLVEIFPSWTTTDPHDAGFVRRIYLYSAFVVLHKTPPSGTDVHIVAFQEGKQKLSLVCCARPAGSNKSTESPCEVNYTPHGLSPTDKGDLHASMMAYRCHFPVSADKMTGAHVTLTATSCPNDLAQFLPVQKPEVRPGKIGLCGKVAYGFELDPKKLVEWFEIQRLLGVDKILMFDLNNTEVVRKVFRHYQASGLFDPLPYKLPGRPWGRVLRPFGIGFDDESLPLIHCRLHLAGYDYILGIDMDEVILPRQGLQLKPFIQGRFKNSPSLSAIFFNVQFFVYEWGPVDPKAPLMMLQYLNSTQARWECQKYIYMPSRIHYVETHTVRSYSGYTQARIPPNKAVIFHFRKCPHVWKTCNPPRITDTSMQRFKDQLVPRVLDVFKQLGL